MKLTPYRILMVLFVCIALVFSSMLYVTVSNYVIVSETKVRIPESSGYEAILIPVVTDRSKDVTLSIVFNVSNPTGADIYVYNIEYTMYMDNVSNPIDWQKESKWDNWYIGYAGFTLGDASSYIRVPSKGYQSVPVNLTVKGGTVFMDHLDSRDPNGKYHPFILPSLRYTFKNINVMVVSRDMPHYYSYQGVLPTGAQDEA